MYFFDRLVDEADLKPVNPVTPVKKRTVGEADTKPVNPVNPVKKA